MIAPITRTHADRAVDDELSKKRGSDSLGLIHLDAPTEIPFLPKNKVNRGRKQIFSMACVRNVCVCRKSGVGY